MKEVLDRAPYAWTGAFPSHWRHVRLGSCFRERHVATTAELAPALSVTKGGVVEQQEQVAKSQEGAPKKLVQPGDLVINSRSDRKGSAGLAPRLGSVSLINTVLEPTEIDAKFAYHLLRSVPFQEEFFRHGSGIVDDLWTTRYAAMKSIQLPMPPEPEQRAIADYLDHETAEIDAFIAESSELIRLMLEHSESQRELVVEEWGGDFVKLKYLADILTGFPFKSDSFKAPGTDRVPLLRGINVTPGSVDWNHTVTLEKEGSLEFFPYLLNEGDLVLGMDRPFISGGLRIAPVSSADKGALLVQRVARLRAKHNVTSPKWLLACLRSSRFRAYLEPDFTGVSVPHVSPGQIGNFRIALPPLAEQAAHLEVLAQSEVVSRAVVADAREAISLARERRAALISAAVTGQIDVTKRHRPVAEVLEEEVRERV